jgi:hypothetical protein
MKPMASSPPDPQTAEQSAEYDRWFRGKVAAALQDHRPPVNHDLVMRQMDAIIDRVQKDRNI